MKKEPFKVGDIVNIKGSDVQILDYRNKNEILVKFVESGYAVKVTANQLRAENLKDLLSPSVYGVGILGTRIAGDNYDKTSKRKLWCSILRRAYDLAFLERNPAYRLVTVNKEMYYFPDFYDWTLDQAGNNLDSWQIDKDILVKGNKEYSFDKCCFVPPDINRLFTSRKAERGDTPIGVSFDKRLNKYKAYVNDGKELVYLGVYDCPIKAFNVYKPAKENVIRERAEIYKELLDTRVYEALMNWKVEITD